MEQVYRKQFNSNHRNQTMSRRSAKKTRPSRSELSQHSSKDSLLMYTRLHKFQQQTISSLSQQLQSQTDSTAQLTLALQAESSKGAALQQHLAAVQCELSVTSSARRLAAVEVDRLGAELEETLAMASEQADIIQLQVGTISSLSEEVHGLQQEVGQQASVIEAQTADMDLLSTKTHGLQQQVGHLQKICTTESRDTQNLRSQLHETKAKLAAAELSKTHMSQQLAQLRAARTSQVAITTAAASNPWKDLLLVLLMLLVCVLPVHLVLGSVLLVGGLFVVGVLALSHTAELMHGVANCWAGAVAAVTYGVQLLGGLRSRVQQLVVGQFQAGHVEGSCGEGVATGDELLAGFISWDSMGREGSHSSRASLSGSISVDVVDSTNSDVDDSSEVFVMVSVKGLAVVAKGCEV